MMLILLSEKFGPLPMELVEVVESAELPQLRRWTERILSADTLSDVLEA